VDPLVGVNPGQYELEGPRPQLAVGGEGQRLTPRKIDFDYLDPINDHEPAPQVPLDFLAIKDL
jgi:hypothetical protein